MVLWDVWLLLFDLPSALEQNELCKSQVAQEQPPVTSLWLRGWAEHPCGAKELSVPETETSPILLRLLLFTTQ